MLRLSAFVPPERVSDVSDALSALKGARHVIVGATTSEGLISLSAKSVRWPSARTWC